VALIMGRCTGCRVCTWGRFEAVGQEASAPCLYFFNTHLDHESALAQVHCSPEQQAFPLSHVF
jgi:hypothetical protein